MPLGQFCGSVDGQVNAGVGVGVGVGRLVPQGRIPNVGQPMSPKKQKLALSITIPQAPWGSVQAVVVVVGTPAAQTHW